MTLTIKLSVLMVDFGQLDLNLAIILHKCKSSIICASAKLSLFQIKLRTINLHRLLYKSYSFNDLLGIPQLIGHFK